MRHRTQTGPYAVALPTAEQARALDARQQVASDDGACRALLDGAAFTCRACGADRFRVREIKLNSTGAEFLGPAWANESARGLICIGCGYVHSFAGPQLRVIPPPS